MFWRREPKTAGPVRLPREPEAGKAPPVHRPQTLGTAWAGQKRLFCAGLNLVDKFTNIVRGLRKEEPKQFSVQASQEGDALVIKRDGASPVRIGADKLHLNKWDEVRYNALESKA